MFGKLWTRAALYLAGSVIGPAILAAQAADSSSQPPPEATLLRRHRRQRRLVGQLAAPNAERTDGPFATLAKARDALRQLDRKKPGTPLVVMVRGGKYFLDETLVLGPEGRRHAPSRR